jgi:hypothetical protein
MEPSKPERIALIFFTCLTIAAAVISRVSGGIGFDQIGLYFAATPEDFKRILSGHKDPFLLSVRWDFVFLIGYGVLFGIIGVLQCRYNFWGVFTLGFGVIGALLDVLENNGLTSAALNLEAFSEPQLGMIQTLCVLKFLCTAIAIVCTAAFFRGSRFYQPWLRLLLQASGALLALGCLLFLAGWRPCSGMFVQVGLLLAIVGLAWSIAVYFLEMIYPAKP